MDAKLQFDVWLAKVLRSVFTYLGNHDVYAKWKPGIGGVVVEAMLAGLSTKAYQRRVEALAKTRGILNDPQALLQAIESKGICKKIVEERRRQMRRWSRMIKYRKKVRTKTFSPRASKDRQEDAGSTSDGAAFYGEHFQCRNKDTERQTARAVRVVARKHLLHEENPSAVAPGKAENSKDPAVSSKQSRPVNDGGVAVAQCTRSQLGAKTDNSERGVSGTKAVLTGEEKEDDIVLVGMSKRQVAETRAL